MHIPPLKKSLFRNKKEALTGLVVVMLATTFLNIVPEFFQGLSSMADEQSIQAQLTPAPPTTRYIIVDEDGSNSNDNQCTVHGISEAFPVSPPNNCNINEAINTANNDLSVPITDPITILFATTLPQVNLESPDLPSILRINSPVIIDGCQSADCSVKEIIRGHADSLWAFKIDTLQDVTIKNIAFTHFLDTKSAPIRSGDKDPPWDLSVVTIEDNYFGTTDGETFVSDNVIVHGIILFLDTTANKPPSILVRNNVFYGTQGTPIYISAKEDRGSECTDIAEDVQVSDASLHITNNKIGVKKDGSGGEGGNQSGDEWGDTSKFGFAGIFICGVHTEIDKNIIGNSRLNPSPIPGMLITRSSAQIHHNEMGVSGSSSNTNIYGKGISLVLNYSTPSFTNGSQIYDNTIGNIKRGNCNSAIYSVDVGEEACSGTAVEILSSTHNLVYGNQIGSKLSENEGYGISMRGFISGSGSISPTTSATSFNKIFKNEISYNKADGIFASAALKQYPSDFSCSDSSSGSSFPPQNCFNTFSQNKIFRNGRYNEPVASVSSSGLVFPAGGPTPPPFPAGGIGIDLKSGSGSTDDNYAEQKEGSTPWPDGTDNDTDISTNDSGDADKGANDLLNYPVINPNTGAPAPNSTSTEIHGNMSTNKDGKFWIEEFRVRCDAENDDPSSVDSTNALNGKCDTDQKGSSLGEEIKFVNGQGFEFLCGALVTKGPANLTGTWSCKPEDFGIDFNGGLITSTATEVPEGSAPKTGKDIVPVVALKYSCELANAVLNTSPCSSITGETLKKDSRLALPPGGLGGLEANIIQALQNTSEFSEDVFIPTPDLSITKKVRGCTGTTKESCVVNSFQPETTTGNSTTVEYRVDTFNNGNSYFPVSVVDNQPTGVTFNQSQCEYFIVDTITDARPTTGAQPCTFTSMNLTIPGSPGTIALPDKKHLVVYLLATVNGTGTLTNVGTVTESVICPAGSASPAANCTSEARVIIQAAPGDVTLTKTVTPSTVTSGSSPQEVRYTVTLTKDSSTTIFNATLSDVFPTTPVAMAYKDCSVSVTPSTSSASFACPPFPPAAIPSPGNLHSGNIAEEITQIVYTYKGAVPANAVTSGPGVTVANTAELIGFTTDPINKQAIANLNILPPGSTGTGSVTIKHVFDSADTGAAIATVTSSTSPIDKDYFIVVTFNDLPTTGITGFKLSNNFAVTAANLNTPMAYSDCQINYFGVTPTGAPVTCTIPTIGGTTEFYPAGINIPQGLTKIIVKYKGRIAASAVAAGNTAYVINQAVVDAPGIADVVRALGTASADATLNINGPGVPAGTGNISITKTADNNVTGNDRSSERIYTPDEVVNYTVTILNNGTGIASGATLRDSLSRNLTDIASDPLPTGSTEGFQENNLTVSSLSIPTGSAGVIVKYRGTLKGNSQFDLSDFNLDSSADPLKDEDFYAPTDADIEENIDLANNNHKDENELLDVRDNKYVSLGDGGDVVIDLGKKVIVDGSGDDFGILEIDHDVDDKDQETEAYTVYVSQDGQTFKKVTSSSTDTDSFDLGRADMTWVQFIKIEDDSVETKADAPGADIDAICLFNIGIQLPNIAEVQFNDQRLTDGELVTVDVTDVFDESLDDSDCVEPEGPAPVIVFPPGPPNIVVPPPENLPITGTMAVIGIMSVIVGWRLRRRNN